MRDYIGTWKQGNGQIFEVYKDTESGKLYDWNGIVIEQEELDTYVCIDNEISRTQVALNKASGEIKDLQKELRKIKKEMENLEWRRQMAEHGLELAKKFKKEYEKKLKDLK